MQCICKVLRNVFSGSKLVALNTPKTLPMEQLEWRQPVILDQQLLYSSGARSGLNYPLYDSRGPHQTTKMNSTSEEWHQNGSNRSKHITRKARNLKRNFGPKIFL